MDDEKQVLEAARRLPLEERVEHKNWKVRSEALDHIKEACSRARSPQDAIFGEAGPLMKALVGDSNANNMDKALEVLCVFLEKADETQAGRIASGVCSTIAAKALKGRPGTVAKATEACLLFVELEQQAAVVEGIMKAFSDKVPKVVVAALDILLKAVSAFGTGVVDFKALMKGLPAVFGASQNDVRNKAKEITVELAAYLGPAVVTAALLEKMPPAMKKDVEKLFEELPPGKRKPERYTRKEQAARAEAPDEPEAMDVDETPAGAGGAEEEADAGLDAYEFATPKEILAPLGKESVVVGDDKVAFWEAFESKKWNMRKGALEKVREAASTTRLATGDYGDLVRELKKVLAKDANINCAAEAANVTGALGLGLRKDFTSYAKQLVPAILERFKEKNIVMSKAAEESLRVLFEHCVTVQDMAEDLVAAMDHKNPKVRLDTAKLVKDSLEKTPKALVMKVQGSVLPALAKLALDPDAAIRDAAQGGMVVFAVKAGGVTVLDKVMDKLDESRKKKIEEMVQEAIKAGPAPGGKAPARAGTAGGSRPGTAAAPSRSAANPPLAPKNTNTARPSAMAAAASAAPKAGAPLRRTASTASGGGTKPKAAAASGSGGGGAAEEDESSVSAPKLSNEELEERMLELFGSATVEGLRSAKWQERLEAMGAVLAKVEELGPDCDPSLLTQAAGFLPGWGDKNFQVLNKSFEVVAYVARTAPGFSKRDAIYAMEGLAEKVHELKHKEKVCEALSLISEAVGPQFVATLLHKRAAANKNPKVLAEALGWIAEAVEAFGLATLNVKTLIDWMKADLGSASAPVRNKAMEVLGKCHAQLGPGLSAFLEGLKPAQLTALEEIFRQNPKTEVVPTRKVRKAGKAGGAAGGKGKGAAAAAAADDEDEAPPSLDDLLPRTDISGRITPSLLSMLTSSNWKERNAGVLEVEVILKEANSRIGPNVGDLLNAMKGRLADSNRNLAAKALMVVGDIGRAMGPAFDKQARSLLGPALANLSDNKKQVRDAVVYLLDSWITIAPADRVFPSVLEAMANPKCIIDGKVTGLAWMTKVVAEGQGAKCGAPALQAVLLGTQDKAAAVREAGNALLAELVKVLGRDPLMAALSSLDSAQKKPAQELLTKALGSAAAAAPVAAAAAAASSRPATAACSRAAEPASKAAPSRPGTSRAAAVAAAGSLSRSSSAAESQAAKGPLLALSTAKPDRARKFRVRPGKFDGLNAEEVEILERELGAIAGDELRPLLFSPDFKKHLVAAELLASSLPELLEEVKGCLDLLLRWVVLRICDGNMQSLVKVLELCKTVLEALGEADYALTDYEAALLLPCIMEKSGHNQDRVRALHRDVMRLSCSLLSPVKVLDFLVLGLGSKNNRTKIECCEEMGCIIQREGMGPLLSCKAKPVAVLAQLLPERDGATRAAALNTIELAWVEEGDGIWRLLGRLENREREMVEDRLKRSKLTPRAAPAAAAAAPAAFEATPVLRRPQTSAYPAAVAAAAAEAPLPAYGRRAESDTLEYARPAFTPPAVLDTPVPGRPAASSYGAAVPAYAAAAAVAYSAAPTPVPPSRPPASPSELTPFAGDEAAFREQWMHAMFGINSGDMAVVVENMKALCGDIMAVAMADGPGTASMRAIMATSANELFSTINRLMPRLLDAAEGEALVTGRPPSSRGCKYALNVLLQGIAVPEVSMALPQGTLRETMSLLLLLLLDERGLVNYEEGSTLMKAINVLMLKMLEATNRTYTFAALLQLLRDPPPEIRPAQLPKFYDLVVKCLIKLTKSLQASMEGVDLADLLFSVHDFFMHLGVDEIRKRSSSDDKPLRMVKTILHELCKMKGYDIYEYAQNIPGRNAEPQPIIFAYIALNLQTLAQSGIIQAPEGSEVRPNGSAGSLTQGGGGSDETGGGGGESQAARSAAMSEAEKAEVKSRLKDIMGRLMHPDQTWAAMEELYWLRKEHAAYVEKYLSTAKVSESFQRYINDGLEEVEARMAEQEGGGEYEDGGGEPVEDPMEYSPLPPRIPRLPLGGGAAPPPLRTSPPGSASRYGASVLSPGLSARSDGSQSSRLSGVRERLSQLRMSGDGVQPSPNRVDVSNMRSSIEELQARMQSLRRSTQG